MLLDVLGVIGFERAIAQLLEQIAIVKISLGCNHVGRRRWRLPEASNRRCHQGMNCTQQHAVVASVADQEQNEGVSKP